MGERMDTKSANAFPDEIKTVWNHGYGDGFHGRPPDPEIKRKTSREPFLGDVYTHGYEAGESDASDGAEWNNKENERPELSPQEFLDLLNGKIAGVTLSINLIMDMLVDENSLSPVKNALSETARFIRDEKDRENGFYNHMPEEYINGTVDVLKDLAKHRKDQ